MSFVASIGLGCKLDGGGPLVTTGERLVRIVAALSEPMIACCNICASLKLDFVNCT